MNINDDFRQRVLQHGDAIPWVPSPTAGVERRMLDRIGDEVPRAPSLVRDAPGSRVPPPREGGGEEFIVLDGVFQDEHGDYPVGSYVRNPPTTRHTPGSEAGCTIFVKLWQFDPADRTSVVTYMNALAVVDVEGRPGVAAATLFKDVRETVQLERWSPNAEVHLDLDGGAELLVLEGACTESGEDMRTLSWLRIPVGGQLNAIAGPSGTRVWIKTGGLRFTNFPTQEGIDQ